MSPWLKALFLTFFAGCSAVPRSASSFRNFHYQLQQYGDLQAIMAEEDSLWVIDENKDNGHFFSRSELASFKEKGHTVIGYLSVGEAEEYRDYYKTLPKSVLAGENAEWKENHLVQFWAPAWHTILKSRLTRMADTGYQGAFLDVLDAFYRFSDKERSALYMADLVEALAKHARQEQPDFKILLQNASLLYAFLPAERQARLLAQVDGGSVESVFVDEHGRFNPSQVDHRVEEWLHAMKKADKWVFSIEYFTNPADIEHYLAYTQKTGLMGLVTDKALSGSVSRNR